MAFSFDHSQLLFFLGTILAFVLVVLLYLAHTVHTLRDKLRKSKVEKRLKHLEREIDEYMTRSGRRLDVFKRVVEGFEHTAQNIRHVIEEEERAEFSARLQAGKKRLLDDDDDEDEAEIIPIGRNIDEEKR